METVKAPENVVAPKARAKWRKSAIRPICRLAKHPGVGAACSHSPAIDAPSTAVELLDRLRKDGVIGAWSGRKDIGDSSEFARHLREEAQRPRQASS